MIKIFNEETYGWEEAVRGMRNPMNSWNKIDSKWDGFGEAHGYSLGENDLSLMKKLIKAGTDHSKFMRMITVYCDITAPLYWWKEYDTYKVGTVANSCSTMHKIHAETFKLEQFSHEYIEYNDDGFTMPCANGGSDDHYEDEYDDRIVLELVVIALNHYRNLYLKTKDKKYWYKMIQLLPTSYNQTRTVQLNYAVLRNMYHSRRNHKLDEWHTFCEWVETLPYAELITDDRKGGE